MNGFVLASSTFLSFKRERMKGMQCGDLSSTMAGFESEVGLRAFAEVVGEVVDILK